LRDVSVALCDLGLIGTPLLDPLAQVFPGAAECLELLEGTRETARVLDAPVKTTRLQWNVRTLLVGIVTDQDEIRSENGQRKEKFGQGHSSLRASSYCKDEPLRSRIIAYRGAVVGNALLDLIQSGQLGRI